MSEEEKRPDYVPPERDEFLKRIGNRDPSLHVNDVISLLVWIKERDFNGRTFEVMIFEMLRFYQSSEFNVRDLEPILQRLVYGEIPLDGSSPEDIRYTALYALCMAKRRDHDPDGFRTLLHDSKKWGADNLTRYGSYVHLRAMMHVLFRDRSHLAQALDCAEQALKHDLLKGHVGVEHHYAEVAAIAAEAQVIKEDDERVKRALYYAKGAVRAEKHFAKFHATMGRLRALHGYFDDANDDLQRAIRLERDGWDSAARRTDYKDILTDINHRRRLKEQERLIEEAMNQRVERMRAIAEQTNVRHAEMLGFFAGILALVLAGIQLAAEKKDSKAADGAGRAAYAVAQQVTEVAADQASGVVGSAVLLLMLGGVLLVAYGGLGWLLRGERLAALLRSLAVVLLGVSLFAAGVMVPRAFTEFRPEWVANTAGIALISSVLCLVLAALCAMVGRRRERR